MKAESTKRISCKEATFLSIKEEHGKLPIRSQLKLALHLRECPPCKRFIEQNKVIKERMTLYKLQQDATLSMEAKRKIQKKIDAES